MRYKTEKNILMFFSRLVSKVPAFALILTNYYRKKFVFLLSKYKKILRKNKVLNVALKTRRNLQKKFKKPKPYFHNLYLKVKYISLPFTIDFNEIFNHFINIFSAKNSGFDLIFIPRKSKTCFANIRIYIKSHKQVHLNLKDFTLFLSNQIFMGIIDTGYIVTNEARKKFSTSKKVFTYKHIKKDDMG